MTSVLAQYKKTRLWSWARENWVGQLVRFFRSCRRECRGWVRAEHVVEPGVAQLTESLAELRVHSCDDGSGMLDTEMPIFLLATAWRSGSTLLQRILVTDRRLLLWGEPLGEMALPARIAAMLSNCVSPVALRLWSSQDESLLSSPATSWIATLSPPADDFRSALRCLFDRWLGEPARRRGFTRWGLKETRLGAAEATLLHWLFPRAKFVILSRHPYDCYRSFADSGWGRLYHTYPEVCIDSATAFARHWNRLALGLSALPAGFPCFHLKYEDLVDRKTDFRQLESWLGIEIKEEIALSRSVGGTARRSRLNWLERSIIEHEAHEGMRALGYSN